MYTQTAFRPQTIADICRERVRRVIARLNAKDGNVNGQDRGFRAYKLEMPGQEEKKQEPPLVSALMGSLDGGYRSETIKVGKESVRAKWNGKRVHTVCLEVTQQLRGVVHIDASAYPAEGDAHEKQDFIFSAIRKDSHSFDVTPRAQRLVDAFVKAMDDMVLKMCVDADQNHFADADKMVTPNVQIEGLADRKTWPEPRKFNNRRPQRERLSASPARMQWLGWEWVHQ